jgi:hypothetical protein
MRKTIQDMKEEFNKEWKHEKNQPEIPEMKSSGKNVRQNIRV